MTDFEKIRKANPFMDHNGIDIISSEKDHCVLAASIRRETLNLHGRIHGGMLMAMADCAGGFAARTDGRIYVTQSVHMNFIHNTSEGTIYAEGSVVSRGRTITVVHVVLRTEDGRLLADSTVDMFCLG